MAYPQVNRRVTVHENQGSRERRNGENQIDHTCGIFRHNPPGDTVHQENKKEGEHPHSTNNQVGEMPTLVAVFDGVEDTEVAVNSHRDQVEDGAEQGETEDHQAKNAIRFFGDIVICGAR